LSNVNVRHDHASAAVPRQTTLLAKLLEIGRFFDHVCYVRPPVVSDACIARETACAREGEK